MNNELHPYGDAARQCFWRSDYSGTQWSHFDWRVLLTFL